MVRCSEGFSIDVQRWLEKHEIAFLGPYVWVDNIPITKKYQKEFRAIFHGYSELAMRSKPTDAAEFFALLDRVTHCFLNNFHLKSRLSEITGCRDVVWESTCLSRAANVRAYSVGRMIERKEVID